MAQKDYLLRQIEKMGVILAGLRELAFGGAPVQALDQLREEAARAGLLLDLLDSLAPDSLLQVIGETSLERLIPAAEVLTLKGELEELLGENEKSDQSFEKATFLASRVRDLLGNGTDPELNDRVNRLFDRLEGSWGDRHPPAR
jgi:hypothetical protein